MLERLKTEGEFQSTRPRGARPAMPLSRAQAAQFQSTRPRGARRVIFSNKGGSKDVSIHAPARGATRSGLPGRLRRVVSIHAPARGATAFSVQSCHDEDGFNPRARAGRDVCQESPLFSSGYNEHSDDLDSSAGKSCASSGEGSIFLFYYATIELSTICRKKRRA